MPRRAVPTEVKKLMGNPGKRALPKPGEEPAPEFIQSLPTPPAWLGKYGKREYRRVGPVLIKNHLLTEADWFTFLAYCANVDLLVEATLQIKERGMTIHGARGPVRNPALATFAAATTSLRSLAEGFGMTPSSRSRMKLPGDEGASLEDLLGDDGEEDAQT
jgi:P27 family predicted phage terminase small subunit